MTTNELARGGTGPGIGSGRIWAWLGLAAFVLGVAVTWGVQFVYSEGDLREGGQRLFNELNTDRNEALFRVTSGLGYLVVAALIVFGVGLRRFLETRAPGSSLPAIILGSILVTAAALGLAMSFRAQVFDGIDYYRDSTATHLTINRLQQDSVLAAWAAMLAATVATAVGGLRERLFPRWLAWLSALLSLLILVAIMTGTPFPANIPALLWLGVMSVWAIRTSSPARAV